MKNRIIITHCEITADKEKIFKMSKNNPILIDAIIKFSKKVADKIETFERKDNIIVTEEGYYFAFYENDLRHV